jgi:hypothetical protein
MLEKDFISASGLKWQRFWTDSLIRKFLGEPDKLGINPHYRTGPKVRLYNLKRVVDVEKTPEFQEAFIASQKRSKQSKTVARNSRRNLSVAKI